MSHETYVSLPSQIYGDSGSGHTHEIRLLLLKCKNQSFIEDMVPPGTCEQQQMSKNASTICLKDNSTFWPTPTNSLRRSTYFPPLQSSHQTRPRDHLKVGPHIDNTIRRMMPHRERERAWVTPNCAGCMQAWRGTTGSAAGCTVFIKLVVEQLIGMYQKWKYLWHSKFALVCMQKKARHPMHWSVGRERKEGRPYSFLPLLSPFPSRSQSMMRTLQQQGRGAKSALCSLARVVRKRSPQSVRPSLDDDNERGVLKREERGGGSSAAGKMGIGWIFSGFTYFGSRRILFLAAIKWRKWWTNHMVLAIVNILHHIWQFIPK